MKGALMAVASYGGHLEQLRLILDDIPNENIQWVSTKEFSHSTRVEVIKDCSLKEPIFALICLIQSFILVLNHRPKFIISTGAAPGVFVLFWGRFFGAKTLWIDSIANTKRLSLSGRICKRIANNVLSQWPSVADNEQVECRGGAIVIFVTAGLQLPFPRLFDWVYDIQKDIGGEYVFQCDDPSGNYEGVICASEFSKEEFDKLISEASLVISHAGMGTILNCVELSVPLVVVPRQFELREHRNRHQEDTCLVLEKYVGLPVAWNKSKLKEVVEFPHGNFFLKKNNVSARRQELRDFVSNWLN